MIVKISNTDYSGVTRLIDRYPMLSKFGYHGEEVSMGFGSCYEGKVIINSPEELFLLSKETNQYIILKADHGCDPEIEIYDGWRE
jgi:hypothetical protein